jgi:hypothetical protein
MHRLKRLCEARDTCHVSTILYRVSGKEAGLLLEYFESRKLMKQTIVLAHF